MLYFDVDLTFCVGASAERESPGQSTGRIGKGKGEGGRGTDLAEPREAFYEALAGRSATVVRIPR